MNYITTDSYNEMKDYSKSIVQTGATIYGGFKLGQKNYNFIKSKLRKHIATTITNEVLESPRIGSANKTDSYHSFNDIIDNYAGVGTKTNLGNDATLYQVDGALNGTIGRFEWIIQNGSTTHRMFIPGGKMNGVPIIK